MTDAPSIATLLLCGAIAWVGFCRITHTGERTTNPLVRRVLVLPPLAATATVFSVLFWGYGPTWHSTLVPAAYLLNMLVGARLWRNGQPKGYERAD